MSSLITVLIILFLVFGTRKGRFDRIEQNRSARRAQPGTEPVFKPDKRLSRQVEEMKQKESAAEGTPASGNGNDFAGQAGTFSERYREDPAMTAGMKGRLSTVPATGRSSILEADDELNTMLAGRKNRRVPGKDSTKSVGMLDVLFGDPTPKRKSGLKDSSLFAGFEDRNNDWLARQLREEQHTKARIMSEMMSLKIDHEKDHRRINKVIGK